MVNVLVLDVLMVEKKTTAKSNDSFSLFSGGLKDLACAYQKSPHSTQL